jgi:hypothetical protein
MRRLGNLHCVEQAALFRDEAGYGCRCFFQKEAGKSTQVIESAQE